MNLRLFSIAVLVSALPLVVSAESVPVSFNHGDFLSAEQITRNGETLVKVRLSKSGKSKVKKLNESSVGQSVHSEIAGVSSDLKLREPIKGDSLEMGPYSDSDAQKILTDINPPQ